MESRRKVVWSEGMLLTPQHFQQWDTYYEHILAERFSVLSPFSWGLTHVDIDHDGLINGRVSILGLQAVLPDGLIVRIPDHDAPPQTRLWGDLFQASTDRLSVYLGVPIERGDAISCQLDKDPGPRLARYSAEYVERIDTTTGDNRREILTARKNLRILFSGEETADTMTLKIAELVRTSSGAIGLRETYIPPCLCISGSAFLMRLLRGLIELLSAKWSSFANVQRTMLEVVGTDLRKLLLVDALSWAVPLLSHFQHVEQVHPETLYLALLHLAGKLTLLGGAQESVQLSRYQHDDLAATFMELDSRIRMMLEDVTPTRCLVIPLESAGDNVWIGRVPEQRLFASSQFYLVASGELPEDQIRSFVPQQIKIGSPSKLKDIVAAALPGVRVYHLSRPPATLPVKAGHQYFRLDDHGGFWDEIKKSQIVALHVPQNLQGLALQLLASKE